MSKRGVQNAQLQGPHANANPDGLLEQFPWISAAEGLDGMAGISRY